ncbi:MAG: hypothetical protein ACJAUY_001560 [Cognaticolwellia sp.]|jgi:hypothetical protein
MINIFPPTALLFVDIIFFSLIKGRWPNILARQPKKIMASV